MQAEPRRGEWQAAGHQHRWRICVLLFVASSLNYVDRQALSVLKPMLEERLGWSEAAYGWMTFCFQAAYGVTMAIGGILLDRIGVRWGLAAAVVAWSAAAGAHALASTPAAFAAARFALGVGEAFLFPAAAKTIAATFGPAQRGVATGIFNAGTSVGVMAAPAIYGLAEQAGWQAAFLAAGAAGLLWVPPWLRLAPPDAPRAALPTATPTAGPLPVRLLLRHPQAWIIFVARLLADPVWGFFLFWLPSYLATERRLPGLGAATLIVPAYLAANAGGLLGGWISGRLVARGVPVGRARFAVMGGAAALMPLTIGAAYAERTWVAIALVSLATAAHQAWSTNVLSLAADLFPQGAVGRVTGLGGLCGAIGAMFMALAVGGALQAGVPYRPLFVAAGLMHPLAFAIVAALAPRGLRAVERLASDGEALAPRLILVGGALVATGGALTIGVVLRWDRLCRLAQPTTAAGGLVAALGVAALGALCVWAARGRPSCGARGVERRA